MLWVLREEKTTETQRLKYSRRLYFSRETTEFLIDISGLRINNIWENVKHISAKKAGT